MENKNLNLVDILKDCPKGTKLYSIIFGVVDFEYIENEEIIVTNNISGDTETFNLNGSWHYGYTDECTLFPAKDQRDWSKFNIEPKFDINTLKPFDKVLVRNGNDRWTCTLFSNIITTDNERTLVRCINSMWTQCVPYNEETKHLVGTIEMPPEKYITWEE
jgi:hypothetical protein